MILKNDIEVYTDGSCNTQHKIGAWAAILFIGENEFVLKNTEINTTNQQMELQAVLNVLDYIKNENIDYSNIIIYTDSQYVAGIEGRIEKFKNQDYRTKAGEPVRNIDLVKKLVFYIENMQINFVKVKAHQKANDTKNYNRFVDKLCRKMVREYVKKL
jgi:ribonuclease HI